MKRSFVSVFICLSTCIPRDELQTNDHVICICIKTKKFKIYCMLKQNTDLYIELLRKIA